MLEQRELHHLSHSSFSIYLKPFPSIRQNICVGGGGCACVRVCVPFMHTRTAAVLGLPAPCTRIAATPNIGYVLSQGYLLAVQPNCILAANAACSAHHYLQLAHCLHCTSWSQLPCRMVEPMAMVVMSLSLAFYYCEL